MDGAYMAKSTQQPPHMQALPEPGLWSAIRFLAPASSRLFECESLPCMTMLCYAQHQLSSSVYQTSATLCRTRPHAFRERESTFFFSSMIQQKSTVRDCSSQGSLSIPTHTSESLDPWEDLLCLLSPSRNNYPPQAWQRKTNFPP